MPERHPDVAIRIHTGFSYVCSEPGFFRITFCIRRKELEVALERVETVCGLPRKAVELSRNCPE